MLTRRVDPRDIVWEEDRAVYRVYFWDTRSRQSHEYEVTDGDVDEVLGWARDRAAGQGWAYTVYAKVGGQGDGPGLVRLCGVVGDPFA
ncbi:hypothetical protein J7W19_22475 [Streptomyces mobaraensis NBRC 13819 = DSM 40847]|uniref:Uncharacterized protein n=1 Tax=Streptomyces mobaraensis (strain ATCC 29032 / DSM 40847 / JCM 4168 / NBRC 13819 / NCIMB 11159 / IPCR 16-22) TaxID=1223523 RepID=M3BE80_STRM1|nr:hypothetical protein [Streptomyces mobaraensis]EME97874.1 hypothetical protein H340_24370 [Streptomyces mobaraensis NBRC 13819 = DSM 40847]QTT75774.1 hypothetical protein J7W19_22475 [Streptomyces mobaraensis NBRC 13819 = DSM 40847]